MSLLLYYLACLAVIIAVLFSLQKKTRIPVPIISALLVICCGGLLFAAAQFVFGPDWMQHLLTFILFACSVFFVLMYLGKNNENRDHLVFSRNLTIAKEHAEIEALKLQLDPHFLFNSLNTLNYLVPTDARKAKQFIQILSEVYRYILRNKSKELVTVAEEISFCRNYFFLLESRFAEEIQLDIHIKSIQAENSFLLPISLQMLIENAVKHNHYDRERPLRVLIEVMEDKVVVRNNKTTPAVKAESFQLGLTNLRSRFQILTNETIVINETEDEFYVQLPIIM